VHDENQLCRLPVPARDHSPAIWLYFRFTLSLRDVEELLAECGIVDDCPVLADEDRLADAKLFAGADPSGLRGFLARLSQLAG